MHASTRPRRRSFEQRERRGTAHAVLAARKAIARDVDDVVVMFGDTPLVRAETLSKLRAALGRGCGGGGPWLQAGRSDGLRAAIDAWK